MVLKPTVGLQAQECRLRHKRASFLVSRRLGKAPFHLYPRPRAALLRLRPFSVRRFALLRSRQKKYVTAYFSVLKRTSKYSRSCSQSVAELLGLRTARAFPFLIVFLWLTTSV